MPPSLALILSCRSYLSSLTGAGADPLMLNPPVSGSQNTVHGIGLLALNLPIISFAGLKETADAMLYSRKIWKKPMPLVMAALTSSMDNFPALPPFRLRSRNSPFQIT